MRKSTRHILRIEKSEHFSTKYWRETRVPPEWRRSAESPAEPGALERAPLLATPMCGRYEFRVPTIFLFQVKKLSSLRHRPVWLARDGLVPLLWFFLRHPEPRGFRGKLLVHHRWWSVVPESWRARVLLYRFEPAGRAARKPRRLVTISYTAPAFCTTSHAEGVLAGLAADPTLRRLLRRGELGGAVEVRDDALGQVPVPGAAFEFMAVLRKYHRGPVRLASFTRAATYGKYEDAFVVELNQKLICADDAHLQYLLREGASFRPERLVPGLKAVYRARLSERHALVGYALRTRRPSLWRDAAFVRDCAYLRTSYEVIPHWRRYGDYPWPLWVEVLADELLKNPAHLPPW